MLGFLFSFLNGLQPGVSGTCNKLMQRGSSQNLPEPHWKKYLPAGTLFSGLGAVLLREVGNPMSEFGPLYLHLLPAAP